MRRSARLIDQLGGAVKRKATTEDEHAKPCDMSIPQSRGLLAGGTAKDDHNTILPTPNYRVAAPVAYHERSIPQSPFLLDHRTAEDDVTLQPTFNDENAAPPRKRRHVVRVLSAIMAEAGGELDETEMSIPPAEPSQDDPPTALPEASPPTWFTPIRISRPPRPPKSTPDTAMTPTIARVASRDFRIPSRAPSFAQWMDGIELAGYDESPLPTTPLNATGHVTENPAAGNQGFVTGGVDMTSLAVIYDPDMAAAFQKSPPTPIEKICQEPIYESPESSQDALL